MSQTVSFDYPLWLNGRNISEKIVANFETPPVVERLTPQDDGMRYGAALRAAFQFFRRNSNGHYSSSALMRVSTAHDRWLDEEYSGLPVVVHADAPVHFDEESEVKSGGKHGMLLVWPDKAMLAVSSIARRKGVGSALLAMSFEWEPSHTGAFWVSAQNNRDAQRFLLAGGLYPTALNGSGAVRYAFAEEPADDEQDNNATWYGDPEPPVAWDAPIRRPAAQRRPRVARDLVAQITADSISEEALEQLRTVGRGRGIAPQLMDQDPSDRY